MNDLDPVSPSCTNAADVWELSAPSTEPLSGAITPNRMRAFSEAWRKMGQAAVMFVATSTSTCFPLPYRDRLGFSPYETSTVISHRTLPVRKLITLGEARRLSLETVRIADQHRQTIVTQQARRDALLDSLL